MNAPQSRLDQYPGRRAAEEALSGGSAGFEADTAAFQEKINIKINIKSESEEPRGAHEYGRTHAPIDRKRQKWLRKKSPEVYDPLTDDDAIALVFPTSAADNRRVLLQRAWDTLEDLQKHGELSIDARRILPPADTE